MSLKPETFLTAQHDMSRGQSNLRATISTLRPFGKSAAFGKRPMVVAETGCKPLVFESRDGQSQ